jgi:Protein of unknown function (DUF2442)
MSSPKTEPSVTRARDVRVSDTALIVDLADGRTISVPVEWYPRLQYGTPAQRAVWQFIGDGEGIHWPELDEDIEVDGLIAGARSGEGEKSFQRWLDARGLKRKG